MTYNFKDLMALGPEAIGNGTEYRDYTNINESDIPAELKGLAPDQPTAKLATWILEKGIGKDVRLALALAVEWMNVLASKAMQDAEETKTRQTNLETQTAQDVAQMQADKDAVIANATVDSEVILARGGKATLGARLDDTAVQLAQTHINAMFPPVPFMGVVPDANYYDEVNFKYYKDAGHTIPATDNRARLQALIEHVHNMGGGTLFLPRGKFMIGGSLYWKTGVSLVGAGKMSTFILAQGVLFDTILGHEGAATGDDYADESVWFDNCTFSDFTIDNKGLSSTNPSVSGKALFIIYMRRAIFKDLLLINTIGTALGCDFLVDTIIDRVMVVNAGRNKGTVGQSGIGIGTGAYAKEPIVVNNCFTYDCGNYGIFVETQNPALGHRAKYAKITNCHAQGNRIGFGNKGSGGTLFENCTSVDNLIYGFQLTEGARDDQLINCLAESNGVDGIMIDANYYGGVDIINTISRNNAKSGIKTTVSGGPVIKGVNVQGGKIYGNGASGIDVAGNIKDLTIKDVTLFNNTNDSSISSAYQRAILVNGTNDKVSIVGNNIYDDQETPTQLRGIDVSAQTTNLFLDGNVVDVPNMELAYSIRTSSVTYGTNVGLTLATEGANEKYGEITFADGELSMWLNHYLGVPPKSILLTPYGSNIGNSYAWVKENFEDNRVTIERNNSEGELKIYWHVIK